MIGLKMKKKFNWKEVQDYNELCPDCPACRNTECLGRMPKVAISFAAQFAKVSYDKAKEVIDKHQNMNCERIWNKYGYRPK